MCGSAPKVKKADPAAPPPPPPEATARMAAATDVTTANSEVTSKRKGRNALRIDLQTGGGGTGLNVAQG